MSDTPTPITLREASRKYNVPLTTLRNWRRYGYLTTLTEPEKRGLSLTVSEEDVSDCAQVYGQGMRGYRGPTARWWMEAGLSRVREGRQEGLPEA